MRLELELKDVRKENGKRVIAIDNGRLTNTHRKWFSTQSCRIAGVAGSPLAQRSLEHLASNCFGIELLCVSCMTSPNPGHLPLADPIGGRKRKRSPPKGEGSGSASRGVSQCRSCVLKGIPFIVVVVVWARPPAPPRTPWAPRELYDISESR